MAILDKIEKIRLLCKTTTGYIKYKLFADDIVTNNGNTVEDELSEINTNLTPVYYKDGVKHCIRFPKNNDTGVQICFGSISTNVTLNAHAGLYTGTATVNHEFLKPFKNISSLQLDNGSYDWIWTVAKSCSNEKISSITFAWLEKYTNKNIHMDYIAIGTY